MTMQVYGYMPGWSVADISPYVSKLYNYLKMAEYDFEMVAQPLATLADDAPRTKLPFVKKPDGTVVPDSTEDVGLERSPGPLSFLPGRSLRPDHQQGQASRCVAVCEPGDKTAESRAEDLVQPE